MAVPANISGTREQGHHPLLAVLTGGIASGKTTVSDCFASLGVEVIDTDLVAREVVEPGQPALAEIVEHFGNRVLNPDGALDRKSMRREIFSDDARRRQLESILHPRIEQRVRERIAGAGGQPYVLLVVPLLVESGLFRDADCVIVVDVPEQVQLERLCARDGIDQEQARAMLEAQASREQRLAVADEVLNNTGSVQALQSAVHALHLKLTERASTSRAER